MTRCNSKSIVYVCTPCRNKGSLSNRLLKFELECARANEQRLGSERLLEERQGRIESLLADKQELISEKNQLLVQLSGKKEFSPFVDTVYHMPKTEHVTLLIEESSSESSQEDKVDRTSRTELSKAPTKIQRH